MSLVVNQSTFNHDVLGASVPVVVNFWAPWCGICRLVNPMLADTQLKWGGRIKLVNINADENLKLANTYKLTNLPTVLVFHHGHVCCRLEQFSNRADLQIAAGELQALFEQLLLASKLSIPA